MIEYGWLRVKKLLKNSVVLYGIASIFTRGLSIIITIVLTPLIIRQLGSTMYGIWFMATLIPTIIAFPDFGISNGIINRVTRTKVDGGNISTIASELLQVEYLLKIVGLIWLVLGALGIVVYSNSYHDNQQRWLILQVLLISLIMFCFGVSPNLWSKIQLALERGHESVFWEGIGKASSLVMSILALNFWKDVRILALATLLPPLLSSLVNAYRFKNSISLMPKQLFLKDINLILKSNWETLSNGMYFTLIQLAFVIGFALDPFLISRLVSVEALSYISVARRPFDALPLVITLFSTALWPVFFRLQADGEIRRVANIIIGLIVWATSTIGLISWGLIAFKDEIFGFLGQNQFIVQHNDLIWISIKTWAVTIVIIINNYLSSANIIREQAYTQTISAVVSIVFVIYFLVKGDLESYLVATGCIYVLLTLIPSLALVLLDIRRKIRAL